MTKIRAELQHCILLPLVHNELEGEVLLITPSLAFETDHVLTQRFILAVMPPRDVALTLLLKPNCPSSCCPFSSARSIHYLDWCIGQKYPWGPGSQQQMDL